LEGPTGSADSPIESRASRRSTVVVTRRVAVRRSPSAVVYDRSAVTACSPGETPRARTVSVSDPPAASFETTWRGSSSVASAAERSSSSPVTGSSSPFATVNSRLVRSFGPTGSLDSDTAGCGSRTSVVTVRVTANGSPPLVSIRMTTWSDCSPTSSNPTERSRATLLSESMIVDSNADARFSSRAELL